MLSKDRARTVAFYKALPGVSRADFETQFKAMIAAMIKLPIVQKNHLLKDVMCFARNNLDEPARAVPFGVAKADATIVAIVEAEIGEDPAFRKLMGTSAQNLGVDLGEIFAMEVITPIDK
ncbi:hypothetical protein FB451DRAFT_1189069 [Mycena latifolia]|nr:hypothetical protein FB451DRAFT_1189069 [Mycena latifolia]